MQRASAAAATPAFDHSPFLSGVFSCANPRARAETAPRSNPRCSERIGAFTSANACLVCPDGWHEEIGGRPARRLRARQGPGAAARCGDADPARSARQRRACADRPTSRRARLHAGEIRVSGRPRPTLPTAAYRSPRRSTRRRKPELWPVPGAPASRARAIALSAVRETYEEAGLLIGEKGGLRNAQERLAGLFPSTAFGPRSQACGWIARAITPPGRVRRFDTRFLSAWRDDVAVELPPGRTDQRTRGARLAAGRRGQASRRAGDHENHPGRTGNAACRRPDAAARPADALLPHDRQALHPRAALTLAAGADLPHLEARQADLALGAAVLGGRQLEADEQTAFGREGLELGDRSGRSSLKVTVLPFTTAESSNFWPLAIFLPPGSFDQATGVSQRLS